MWIEPRASNSREDSPIRREDWDSRAVLPMGVKEPLGIPEKVILLFIVIFFSLLAIGLDFYSVFIGLDHAPPRTKAESPSVVATPSASSAAVKSK